MSIELKCECGALQGNITLSTKLGRRIVCMCDDCQAYAHFLGRADQILDKNGGTDIFPVRPCDLHLTHGLQNLKCMRLSDQGMYRWYAGCCKTPIGNSMTSPKVPYIGLITKLIENTAGQSADAVAGPVHARVLGKFGIGPLPPGTSQKVSFKMIAGVIQFLVPALLKKAYEPSPFFKSVGEPIVEPQILTADQLSKLKSLTGDRPVGRR